MTISDLHGESQCVIDHFSQADGFRNGFTIHSNLIISKIAGRIHFCTLMDVDAVEQLPRGGIAKRAAVLEYVQLANRHVATRRRAIELEHIQNRLPQYIEVFIAETGDVLSELGGDVAVHTVEAIGDDEFVAHGVVFLGGIRFRGNGDTGDGYLLNADRIDGAGEPELHRTPHLTARQTTLDECGHHRAKGANVKELVAHIVAQTLIQFGIGLLQSFDFFGEVLAFKAGVDNKKSGIFNRCTTWLVSW